MAVSCTGITRQDASWPVAPHWMSQVLPHWNTDIQQRWAHLEGVSVHNPPHYLHSAFYPKRGPYSSRDRSVVRSHFDEMRAHGIDAAVVSWTGREGVGTSDTQGVVTDEVLPLVLQVAAEAGIKISIHLEPYEGRSPASIRKDLEYLQSHWNSEALLRMKRPDCEVDDCEALPVFYVYDSYHNPATEWAQLLCTGTVTHLTHLMVLRCVLFNLVQMVQIAFGTPSWTQ